jgi:hypothetical protein
MPVDAKLAETFLRIAIGGVAVLMAVFVAAAFQ